MATGQSLKSAWAFKKGQTKGLSLIQMNVRNDFNNFVPLRNFWGFAPDYETPVIIDSNPIVNCNDWRYLGGDIYNRSHSFVTGNIPFKLHSIDFYLRRVGNPTGTLEAYLYLDDDGIGEPIKILAASGTVNCSSVGTAALEVVKFSFTDVNKIPIPTGGKRLQVGIHIAEGDTDWDNYFQFGTDTGLHHSGYSYYTEPGWSYTGVYDAIFYLYGEPSISSANNFDYHNFTDEGHWLWRLGGDPNMDAQEVAQSITAPLYPFPISYAGFLMKKYGAPTGNAYAKIYEHSNLRVYGDTSIPTGSPIAISDALDVSTLNTQSKEIVFFAFSGVNKIKPNPLKKYVCSVEFTGGDDNYNYLYLYDEHFYTGLPQSYIHPGNLSFYKNGDWTAYYTHDLIFYLVQDMLASGPVHLKTINGILKANIKTINGIALANIKTLNGVA